MLKRLVITAQQANLLPETNAIASTPDQTEYYINVCTAQDLELFDEIAAIEPEVLKLVDEGATVIHLSY